MIVDVWRNVKFCKIFLINNLSSKKFWEKCYGTSLKKKSVQKFFWTWLIYEHRQYLNIWEVWTGLDIPYTLFWTKLVMFSKRNIIFGSVAKPISRLVSSKLSSKTNRKSNILFSGSNRFMVIKFEITNYVVLFNVTNNFVKQNFYFSRLWNIAVHSCEVN